MRGWFVWWCLCWFAVTPAFAQLSDACSPADLQAWYDTAIDAGALTAAWNTVVNGTAPLREREQALADFIEATQTDALRREFPRCLGGVQFTYIRAVNDLVRLSRELLNDGDAGAFFVGSLSAFQRIGEFRGYLMGVGVDVRQTLGGTLYLW